MYKEYFHLRCEPFNITPDPRFLYMTAQHQEALNHLLYGIRQRKGFLCLTGEVGAGKTTLCRALLAHLGTGVHTALILNPMLSGTQFLRAVLTELGLPQRQWDRLRCLSELNRFLLDRSAAGREVVLIVDEAQDMPPQTLELLRLLSNLETDSHKLLQIVLVGQPELRDILAKPSLRQLAQRIAVRFHLGTLTYEDTARYIRHRLAVAGETAANVPADAGEALSETSPAEPPAASTAEAAGPSTALRASHAVEFDDEAIAEIHRYSKGTPRLINSLGDKALLAGYVYGMDRIDGQLVRLAAAEMKEALA